MKMAMILASSLRASPATCVRVLAASRSASTFERRPRFPAFKNMGNRWSGAQSDFVLDSGPKDDLRVTISTFRGHCYVDIRRFAQLEGERNEKIATKKGVTLSVDQWNELKSNIPEINRLVEAAAKYADNVDGVQKT